MHRLFERQISISGVLGIFGRCVFRCVLCLVVVFVVANDWFLQNGSAVCSSCGLAKFQISSCNSTANTACGGTPRRSRTHTHNSTHAACSTNCNQCTSATACTACQPQFNLTANGLCISTQTPTQPPRDRSNFPTWAIVVIVLVVLV